MKQESNPNHFLGRKPNALAEVGGPDANGVAHERAA